MGRRLSAEFLNDNFPSLCTNKKTLLSVHCLNSLVTVVTVLYSNVRYAAGHGRSWHSVCLCCALPLYHHFHTISTNNVKYVHFLVLRNSQFPLSCSLFFPFQSLKVQLMPFRLPRFPLHPQVMITEEYNEKVDIYSFALVGAQFHMVHCLHLNSAVCF